MAILPFSAICCFFFFYFLRTNGPLKSGVCRFLAHRANLAQQSRIWAIHFATEFCSKLPHLHFWTDTFGCGPEASEARVGRAFGSDARGTALARPRPLAARGRRRRAGARSVCKSNGFSYNSATSLLWPLNRRSNRWLEPSFLSA